jgi:hypothetical protein
MSDQWEKALSCAEKCANCEAILEKRDRRILSVYTHAPICMNCKQTEEKQPDYADVSKGMIGQCIQDTGRPYGDPGGYCFHHFCPYKC